MNKLYIETLGCPKNWVDSERLLGGLKNITITSDPKEAETIIVNTCSFINSSRVESIDSILELAKFKETGLCKKFIVSGCLVSSHESDLRKELYEVDFFHSSNNSKELIEFLDNDSSLDRDNERHFLRSKGNNYLKIAEGCNHNCTFCTIPQFKGRVSTRNKDELISEVEKMVSSGFDEVTLVAQDLTSYGVDTDDHNLCLLLRSLVKVKGLKWIRLLYLYPTLIDDELINIVSNEEKICRYFDIPLQYLDDRILKSMGRTGNVNLYWDLIQKIRDKIKEVAIRTTIIVGFPGENDDIFNCLINEVKRFRFDYLGAFEYSPEESTKSYSLANHVDSKVKSYRLNKLMESQAGVSANLIKKRIGKSYEVIIEDVIPKKEDNFNYYIARSEFEAAEVDGNIVFSSDISLIPGQRVRIRVISSSQYDLYGILL